MKLSECKLFLPVRNKYLNYEGHIDAIRPDGKVGVAITPKGYDWTYPRQLEEIKKGEEETKVLEERTDLRFFNA